MCGIAGIVRFDGAPVAREDLAAMAEAQRHRGPDGDGIWAEGPVGFGHRRLAIIDLSSGGHPADGHRGGDVVIVYNGEVYNFRELRRGAGERSATGSTRAPTPKSCPRLRGVGRGSVCSGSTGTSRSPSGTTVAAAALPRPRPLRREAALLPLTVDRSSLFGSEIKALFSLPGCRAASATGAERVFHLPEHLHRPDAVRRASSCCRPAAS